MSLEIPFYACVYVCIYLPIYLFIYLSISPTFAPNGNHNDNLQHLFFSIFSNLDSETVIILNRTVLVE